VEVNGENPTNPLEPDTDEDGLNDGDEDRNFDGVFDPNTEPDPNHPDSDGDLLNDGLEESTGTDPRASDTDGDGLDDGVEDANHNGIVEPNETDPRKYDTDGDGLGDGEDSDPLSGVESSSVGGGVQNSLEVSGASLADGCQLGWGFRAQSLIPLLLLLPLLFPRRRG